MVLWSDLKMNERVQGNMHAYFSETDFVRCTIGILGENIDKSIYFVGDFQKECELFY